MEEEHVPGGVGLVWDQAEKRLDAQIRQAEALDTKAGILVGLHALAAGLIVTVAPRFEGRARWIVVAVIVGLILSGMLAFKSFRTERYDRSPAPEELWTFAHWNEQQIKYRML